MVVISSASSITAAPRWRGGVDCRDDRHWQTCEAGYRSRLEITNGRLLLLAEVRTGTEYRPGSAQHDELYAGVDLDRGKVAVERQEDIDVERVALLGPIEGQRHHPAGIGAEHRVVDGLGHRILVSHCITIVYAHR